MTYNKNQIGRILLQKLVEETGCDMQIAMRFYYNSDLYSSLHDEIIECEIEELYSHLLKEYELGKS